MKFKRNKLIHWYYLICSIIVYLLVVPIAYLAKRSAPNTVILYGHKFNGNLWAFYDQKLKNNSHYRAYYLSMDKDYVEDLRRQGLPALWTGRFSDLVKVALASSIITDHHPQLNALFILNPKIKFIDVWHGIPFKGFLETEFDYLKRYSQIWTNSNYMAGIYTNKYHFPESKIKVTGYGRVDALINHSLIKEDILNKYGIKGYKKYVLIATTWKQDSENRITLPFGMNAEQLFPVLNSFGNERNTLFIIRSHLNDDQELGHSTSNVKLMSYKEFPVAEDFLFAADALITDWSSIAFDYLVLNRPAIFLDVKAPFNNHFTYGPEHRFGPVASSLESLLLILERYSAQPELYKKEYSYNIKKTQKVIYDGTDDGKSLDRYLQNLSSLFN